MTIPFVCTFDVMSPAGTKDSPRDWDHSGIGLDRYATTVLRYGLTPTVFVSGEAARAHAPMLEELRDRGIELGLLIAPNSNIDAKKAKHMGTLSATLQAEVLQAGIHLFHHYLGFRPTTLRTALYSANANTYDVAAAAGFRHVAFRLPGAALPVIGTVWDERKHVLLRSGMIDVPVTTDPTEKLFNRFPLYLAPEIGTPETHVKLITLGKTAGVVCMTGATNGDYWDKSGSAIRALEAILDYVTQCADEFTPFVLSQLTVSGAPNPE
jgi:peptidoglycan/xylan/chitin deacetylase (PgdA/CDA1 family)